MIASRNRVTIRAAAEAVVDAALGASDTRIALVGPTLSYVTRVMIFGESGLIACSGPTFRPHYRARERRLSWPNGASATAYSVGRPHRLRGPRHSLAWAASVAIEPADGANEAAAWWELLVLGLSEGSEAPVIVSEDALYVGGVAASEPSDAPDRCRVRSLGRLMARPRRSLR